MVERRPLIMDASGEVKELPVGDTVIGSDSGFLPTPENLDDSDTIYFYFGWEIVEGGWLVRRQLRSDSSVLNATESNNGLYSDLVSAWLNRLTLTYS